MTVVNLIVDGRAHDAEEGRDLLRTLLELGYDVPYFCWHPALGSVGACRQCAVKQFEDEHDDTGEIVMSCMTPVSDGMLISVDDPEVRRFRAQIIEWLMLNHPHDCPVCDEGGECHLQDMTVMTGHARRRSRFPKRTHHNQQLGPLIHHEMNRCIQCYRCVRFYQDYAGGRDLTVLGCHDHVYFGRFRSGTLESGFAGNLVEVCPTGVFTDKRLRRRYTRKWDLQMAPAVCVHCAQGCNVTLGAREGTLRRVLNRYNGEVNGYFICDRGRFGAEPLEGPSRLRAARVVVGGQQTKAAAGDALVKAAALLDACDRIIGVGSPRASLESNAALRALVGPENFVAGLAPAEAAAVAAAREALRTVVTPTLSEVERCDATLLLDEAPSGRAPRLALALRQSSRQAPLRRAQQRQRVPEWDDAAMREMIQDDRGPLVIATAVATWLDDLATERLRAAPDDIARFALAVAAELGDEAAAVDGLDSETAALARRTAETLTEAERPLVVTGTGSAAVVEAAARVARALGERGRLVTTMAEVNTLGLSMLGAPSLDQVSADDGELGLLVLENDLFRRLPEPQISELLDRCSELVVLDQVITDTTRRADVVLPTASFAEAAGTYVSSEGRAQRSFAALEPEDGRRAAWRWIRALSSRLEHPGLEQLDRLDDATRAAAEAADGLGPIVDAAPDADHRLLGRRVPRQTFRSSGRQAVRAHQTIHEPQPPPDDPDSALGFTMEGAGTPPPALRPFAWAPLWNSVQAWNQLQSEIGGALRGGDPGVRLLEPIEGSELRPPSIPAPFEPREGQLLVVARPEIFGGEELSARSPALAELIAEPTVTIHPDDAEALGVSDEITLEDAGRAKTLAVRISPDHARGVASLGPAPGGDLPAWARVRAGGDDG